MKDATKAKAVAQRSGTTRSSGTVSPENASSTRRAVCYLRCSTLTNADGDTFERQRAAVQKYARKHRLELVSEFQDVVSGAKELEHREGLSDLVEHVRSGGVDVVLVERGDRVARDALVHQLIVNKLVDLGVDVITSDGVNLGVAESPTEKFVQTILAALAELDRALIVSRLRAARERAKKAHGKCEGRKGYADTPEGREALTRARVLRRKKPGGKRRSFREVARILTDEGFATQSGRPWDGAVLSRALARR